MPMAFIWAKSKTVPYLFKGRQVFVSKLEGRLRNFEENELVVAFLM